MSEPDVPQVIPQAPAPAPKVVEEQLGAPSTTPAKFVPETVFANAPHEGSNDLTRSEVAEHKTALVAPEVVAASTFTFQLPKGGKVPAIPSGFDAGSWSGAFDFNPPADDAAANAAADAGEVGSIYKTTEVQEPTSSEAVDGVAADKGHSAVSSPQAGVDVGATSGPEDTKQGPEMAEDESEDHSDKIQELAAVINACDAYWADAASGNNAPSAFVKIAEDLHIIMDNITSEGDFRTSSALSKISPLCAQWQAFTEAIKAYINITSHFHPNYEYRFGRFSEQYRLDVELLGGYECLSQLAGAPDLWRNEADKLREANNSKLEAMKMEISTMKDLHRAYFDKLDALKLLIDCEAVKKMADETLMPFHENIVKAVEAFGLWEMGDAFSKERKTPPTVVGEDEEW
jgi:hypothetical protein